MSAAGDASKWETMWANGIAPGEAFDAGRAEPSLAGALAADARGELDPTLGMRKTGKGLKAFVPGCGRGYAVAALASSERFSEAVGLEISTTAQAAATEYLKSAGVDNARVDVGDFFALGADASFDLVYDCTFLCALPPDLRDAWADTMGRIVKPGGELFQVVFPINPDRAGGPPFALDLPLCESLLVPRGFVLRAWVADVPSGTAARSPALGREGVARWAKAAT